jgi:hypothetical protein
MKLNQDLNMLDLKRKMDEQTWNKEVLRETKSKIHDTCHLRHKRPLRMHVRGSTVNGKKSVQDPVKITEINVAIEVDETFRSKNTSSRLGNFNGLSDPHMATFADHVKDNYLATDVKNNGNRTNENKSILQLSIIQ